MASIRKLKSGKWQVVIRKSNHKHIFKTFREKAVAKKFARDVEQQIEKDVYTDYGNAETITIKDLIIKYRDEIVVEHKAKRQTTYKLNKLLRLDVAAQFLLRLRSSHIYKLQQQLKRPMQKAPLPQVTRKSMQSFLLISDVCKRSIRSPNYAQHGLSQ